MKLSIVIPAYNAEPFINVLLDALDPQMTKDVEVLVIDDGSSEPFKTNYKWCKVIHKKNGGCASARNVGIERSKGDYIAFVDSDDLVAKDYVAQIIKKTEEDPDVIEMSWRSLNSGKFNYQLKGPQDRLTNNSVWCRVFKRSFIGDTRFNELKDSTEDEDFSRHIGCRDEQIWFKRAVICDYMYLYRDDLENSKIKRFKRGIMNTKRVTYYYSFVKSDMTDLLEEIKEEDKKNEVILMTEQCNIPELSRYCQIIKPQRIWTHYLRGETYNNIEIIKPPLRTQIVIYRRYCHVIGGLMTFINNFAAYFSDEYDITLVTERLNPDRMAALLPKIKVLLNPKQEIACDTLIMLSILDALPENVLPKKIVRMCHTCRTNPEWNIPDDYDELAFVSETSRKSFSTDKGEIIHNLITTNPRRPLLLVSATRLPAKDKGDLETRFYKLVDMLNEADIPFIWLNFADGQLKNPPKNFYNMGITLDIQNYIKMADYVVTLSDSEAWSYTVLESLTLGTPLICTPFPSAFEMGVEDKVNAHVVPFDMDFDVNILLDIPEFSYDYDNEAIMEQWRKLLGRPKPFEKPDLVLVEANIPYYDIELGMKIPQGTQLAMTRKRAQELVDNPHHMVRIIGG